ncbi:MAG: SDR family oxidoreductase, partial [Lachnospiraceae bacterium]|nr:SDR family oxidoreductase [Lachnospiraceae bacterium]
AYVASKAAVIGATKKLARELSPFGIRVNAISPGIVDTDMAAQMSDEQKSEVKDRVSMKREADPSEIANVALFLASDLSSYMTGQVVRVDGGM